jgi:hypothetical protein
MMNNCTLKPYAQAIQRPCNRATLIPLHLTLVPCDFWRASRPIEYLAGYRAVARPERFERPTPWFVGRISIASKYLIDKTKVA